MNERIRLLWLKAAREDSSETWDTQEQFIERFAKLIVQECASKVDWILAEGGKTQGDLIKQHFGVEE